MFANIENIKKVQNEIAAIQAKKDAKELASKAEKVSQAITKATIESICFQ